MVHRSPENGPGGLYLQCAAAAHVVIEHHDPVGTECGLDDVGALGIVAPTHVAGVVEAAHPRWPPSERCTVLIHPEGLVVAHVLDLHRMTRKARRLGFGSGRRLVCIGEGALYPGCEKVDLRLHHKRLGF